jgi:4-hydroxybenzoate polyprenyltransferase
MPKRRTRRGITAMRMPRPTAITSAKRRPSPNAAHPTVANPRPARIEEGVLMTTPPLDPVPPPTAAAGALHRRLARPFVRIGRRLLLALREARPAVQLIFLLRLVSAAVLSGVLTRSHLLGVAAGALIWECAVVFVYLYNGVADVTEDSVNRTGRPVASGELPRASAAAMALGAGAVAVLGGVVDRPLLLPVIGLLILGYLYSGPPFRLKRFPSYAFLVAALGGLLTYYAGVAAAGRSSPPVAVLVLAGFMSVWMGAVGTTTKDLSDVAGDAAAGRRSLPIRLGERRVRAGVAVLAPALGVAFVLTCLTLAVDGELGHRPYLEVLPAACVVLIGAIMLAAAVLTPIETADRHRQRRPYRIFMTTQLGAHTTVLLAAAILTMLRI